MKIEEIDQSDLNQLMEEIIPEVLAKILKSNGENIEDEIKHQILEILLRYQQHSNISGNLKSINTTTEIVQLQQIVIDGQQPPDEIFHVKPYPISPFLGIRQWWKKRLHKYPFYEQQSAADCGTACLMMIGKYWGKSFNIYQVREVAMITPSKSSLKTLSVAAESLGFNSRPVKANVDQLTKQRLPLIAHWQRNHYVVVYEISAKQFIIGDPMIGQRQISREEFCKNWSGFCLLIKPNFALNSTDNFHILIEPNKADGFFSMSSEKLAELAQIATTDSVKELHKKSISTYGLQNGIIHETKPNSETLIPIKAIKNKNGIS